MDRDWLPEVPALERGTKLESCKDEFQFIQNEVRGYRNRESLSFRLELV